MKERIVVEYRSDELELRMEIPTEGANYTELNQAFLNFLKGIGYAVPPEADVV